MKDKNLNILSPWTSNPLLYFIYNFYIYNNLVDTCNIALILFVKCDVTKFRTPPPPCHTMLHFVDPHLPPKITEI